ncbi:hypothetical protein [Pseudomonas sp.]|uniref:hypothetical protein n=1 Tax=Pseudomonas sp. TaxID=306 RepID=UPI003C75A1D6
MSDRKVINHNGTRAINIDGSKFYPDLKIEVQAAMASTVEVQGRLNGYMAIDAQILPRHAQVMDRVMGLVKSGWYDSSERFMAEMVNRPSVPMVHEVNIVAEVRGMATERAALKELLRVGDSLWPKPR